MQALVNAIVDSSFATLSSVTTKTTKALPPERNEHLRGEVRALIEKEFRGNESAAARAFGVSGSMLSEFLRGLRGAGPKLLNGVADYTGRSTDDLYGRPPLVRETSGYVKVRSHAQWTDRSTEAKAKSRTAKPEQIERIGDVALSKLPTELTVEFLIRLAEAIAHATPVDDEE